METCSGGFESPKSGLYIGTMFSAAPPYTGVFLDNDYQYTSPKNNSIELKKF